MNKNSKIIAQIAVFLCTINTLWATTNINTFKFNITKACMEFVNKDAITYPQKAEGNFVGTEITQLKEYYSVLTNANKKIDEIYTYKIPDTITNLVLDKYISFARNAVLNGGKGSSRKDRMKAELSVLNKELDAIKNNFIAENTHTTTPTTATEDNILEENNTTIENKKDGWISKLTDYLPYVFTLLGLAVLGFYFNSKLNNKSMSTNNEIKDQQVVNSSSVSDEEFKTRVIKILKEQLQNDEIINIIQSKLKKDSDVKTKIVENKTNNESNIKNTEKVIEQQIQAPKQETSKPIIKYARQADKTDGFSNDILKSEPDSYCLFVITITGNTATYKFYDTALSQETAKDYFEQYFNNICNYDKLPNRNNNIKNNGDGSLILESNLWKITKKAELKII